MREKFIRGLAEYPGKKSFVFYIKSEVMLSQEEIKEKILDYLPEGFTLSRVDSLVYLLEEEV